MFGTEFQRSFYVMVSMIRRMDTDGPKGEWGPDTEVIIVPQTCPQCGAPFVTDRTDRRVVPRTCSPKCGAAYRSNKISARRFTMRKALPIADDHPEIEAMRAITHALSGLDHAARERVLNHIREMNIDLHETKSNGHDATRDMIEALTEHEEVLQ